MRHFASALIFLACSLTLFAQNSPKADIFAGFSYLNYEAVSVNLPSGTETIGELCPVNSTICTSTVTGPSSINFNPRMGLYGWNGSVTAVLAPWFGFTTDVSGNYGTSTRSASSTVTIVNTPACFSGPCSPITITTTNTYQYTVSEPILHHFLFGPQFSFPTGKMRTYAHFLVGGDRRNVSTTETITPSGSTIFVSNPATSSVPVNAFAMGFGGGADYPLRKGLSWRTGADYLTSTGTAQNHIRVSTGLVWRVGK